MMAGVGNEEVYLIYISLKSFKPCTFIIPMLIISSRLECIFNQSSIKILNFLEP